MPIDERKLRSRLAETAALAGPPRLTAEGLARECGASGGDGARAPGSSRRSRRWRWHRRSRSR